MEKLIKRRQELVHVCPPIVYSALLLENIMFIAHEFSSL